MDCIFCEIVNNKIPCMTVYEDEFTLVFMDIAKDVDGHMIAIPKKHCKNIFDCDIETLAHLMETVKKVSDHCINECGYSGINLLNANDKSAGQSVPHFHIHIIPRKSGDNIDAWPIFNGTTNEISALHEHLKFH